MCAAAAAGILSPRPQYPTGSIDLQRRGSQTGRYSAQQHDQEFVDRIVVAIEKAGWGDSMQVPGKDRSFRLTKMQCEIAKMHVSAELGALEQQVGREAFPGVKQQKIQLLKEYGFDAGDAHYIVNGVKLAIQRGRRERQSIEIADKMAEKIREYIPRVNTPEPGTTTSSAGQESAAAAPMSTNAFPAVLLGASEPQSPRAGDDRDMKRQERAPSQAGPLSPMAAGAAALGAVRAGLRRGSTPGASLVRADTFGDLKTTVGALGGRKLAPIPRTCGEKLKFKANRIAVAAKHNLDAFVEDLRVKDKLKWSLRVVGAAAGRVVDKIIDKAVETVATAIIVYAAARYFG